MLAASRSLKLAAESLSSSNASTSKFFFGVLAKPRGSALPGVSSHD